MQIKSWAWRVSLIGVFIIAATSLLHAIPREEGGGSSGAQTFSPDAKTPPTVITKTDNTTVRGAIISADRDQVTIKPMAKPGQKEEIEPIQITWKEIKTVSNGLTQAKMVEQWKAQNHDSLCPTCKGNRTILCPTCKGTKHDPASGKDCPTCKGELLVDCKAPKCKNGVIPCPNTCLKLSEGTWVKKADGLRWRTFQLGNKSFFWSEHHLGEVIVVDRKADEVRDEGVCTICNGRGEIDCRICLGFGKVPCPACLARKNAPPCPDHCDNGRVKCPTCDGTGLKKPGTT